MQVEIKTLLEPITLPLSCYTDCKLWKQCTLKPGHQRGLTGKTCNDGLGVNASTVLQGFPGTFF